MGTHDSELGRAVVGRVPGLERLGPNDVADGEGATDDRGSKGTLSATSNVGHRPLKPKLAGESGQREWGEAHIVEHRERGDDSVGEVDARQATRPVGGGKEGHQGATNDTLTSVSVWLPTRSEG